MFYYCQTSVLLLYNGGIFSGYQSLLALYLSGNPSLRTGTRPPSCLYIDKRLSMPLKLSFWYILLNTKNEQVQKVQVTFEELYKLPPPTPLQVVTYLISAFEEKVTYFTVLIVWEPKHKGHVLSNKTVSMTCGTG